ncbi:MAG: pyridoxamine 5'-phosphate oxidase family protein [Rhizobiales bacterium]|nr:pyridoxamine 5'-phosphate oxidase family protein [Hyphomicrobiales bacterium]
MDDGLKITDSFAGIDADAWRLLEQGAGDPQSGFHYVTLCTVGRTGLAQARTVVLRKVSAAERMLEIHTDVRSPKWAELSAQPQATVLGFCNSSRVQLRLQGGTEQFSPKTDVARAAWARLAPSTRATYQGGPPGDDLAFPPAADQAVRPVDGAGHENFGVIRFRANLLDWFCLQRNDNRRALFAYGPEGKVVTQMWVNP